MRGIVFLWGGPYYSEVGGSVVSPDTIVIHHSTRRDNEPRRLPSRTNPIYKRNEYAEVGEGVVFEDVIVSVARVASLLNKVTLFLCNVSVVNTNLRGLTNNGVRNILRGLASSALGNIVFNALVANIVRSSTNAIIVYINLMGSNVVALARSMNIVVNTGVNAAIANRLVHVTSVSNSDL